MERGELVSDALITGIVSERLSRSDVAGGFVLDGFPRTVPQAEALDALVAGGDPLIVVEMKVPDEELVRRVQGRRVCKVCGTNVSAFGADPANVQRCEKCGGELVSRSDDTEAVVRERLKIYWRDTRPIIAYYGGRRTFRSIDGAQTPEQVRQALIGAVSEVAAAAGLPDVKGARGPVGRQGSGGVITCRSSVELERLARVNGLVARVLSELMAAVAPGKTTRRARRTGGTAVARGGCSAGLQGLSRVSVHDLRFGERAGDSRDPERPTPGRRGHPVDRSRRQARRVLRGFGGDGAGRGRCRRRPQRLLTVTKESLERAIAVVKAGARVSRHRRGGAAARRGARLLGGAGVRRTRDRDVAPRGAPDSELRNAGPGLAAGRGHGAGDRADGQRRQAGGEGAERRVDGGHEGRQPVGALRAHGGGDRGRAAAC